MIDFTKDEYEDEVYEKLIGFFEEQAEIVSDETVELLTQSVIKLILDK